jgi:hypothetical protein
VKEELLINDQLVMIYQYNNPSDLDCGDFGGHTGAIKESIARKRKQIRTKTKQ